MLPGKVISPFSGNFYSLWENRESMNKFGILLYSQVLGLLPFTLSGVAQRGVFDLCRMPFLIYFCAQFTFFFSYI